MRRREFIAMLAGAAGERVSTAVNSRLPKKAKAPAGAVPAAGAFSDLGSLVPSSRTPPRRRVMVPAQTLPGP
jgi:hypothetical protein